MRPCILAALKLLGTYTAGSYDLWSLAGNQKASARAHVMSVAMGLEWPKKCPQSKAGVNALRTLLYAECGIAGSCEAVREEAFRRFCRDRAEDDRPPDEGPNYRDFAPPDEHDPEAYDEMCREDVAGLT